MENQSDLPSKKHKNKEIQKRFKNEKKAERAKEVIAKQRNQKVEEIFTDVSTPFLLLPNFGAGSGIKIDEINEFFRANCSGFQETFLFDKQTYALLAFDSSNEASLAIQGLHLTETSKFGGKLLLLFNTKLTPPRSTLNENDIPGLHLIRDFVTTAEEYELVPKIKAEQTWATLNNRKVKHYGYEFDYKANKITNFEAVEALPAWALPLVDRLMALNIIPFTPDQMTINWYEAGAGIPGHVETHSAFEDGVCSLSLLSQYVMMFRHPKDGTVELPLVPRSMLILTKEARYLWSHGINPRKTDYINDTIIERGTRISLTFRKIRNRLCECSYHAQCDSWLAKPIATEGWNTRIEETFVKEVYDHIAPHFSATRYKPWPKIEKYLNDLPVGSAVCDIGCGNGKYLGVNSNLYMFGNDQSVKLIEIARDRGFEVGVMNALQLPLRDSSFDHAISIAVIHHFSTLNHRIQAVREMVRIIRKGGTLLIYVWALEQKERSFGQQDVMVPWHLKENFLGDDQEGDSASEAAPIIEKDNHNFALYQRYYHMFRKGELSHIISDHIPEVKVVSEEFDHQNWAVVCQKL